jgi:hypothetical protein
MICAVIRQAGAVLAARFLFASEVCCTPSRKSSPLSGLRQIDPIVEEPDPSRSKRGA